jgi:hypothetical protein
MSVTCKTCTHPAKEEIDKALLAGQPYRGVAKQYEASAPSVYRHQQDHLPAAMVKAVEAAEIAHGDSLLEQLKWLQVKALGILTKAEQAGDLRTALIAVREVRSTLELVGKVTGELVSRHEVSVSHLIMPGKSLEELEDRARRLDALLAGVVEGTGFVLEDGG